MLREWKVAKKRLSGGKKALDLVYIWIHLPSTLPTFEQVQVPTYVKSFSNTIRIITVSYNFGLIFIGLSILPISNNNSPS